MIYLALPVSAVHLIQTVHLVCIQHRCFWKFLKYVDAKHLNYVSDILDIDPYPPQPPPPPPPPPPHPHPQPHSYPPHPTPTPTPHIHTQTHFRIEANILDFKPDASFRLFVPYFEEIIIIAQYLSGSTMLNLKIKKHRTWSNSTQC